MGNEVYANLREVSCKAADGKSICSFPDVCFTPPENPTTPPGVPIPYPNTGMAKDTAKGSRNVKITKKEVMLKNSSYFKKSMGDEAGSAAKKGVITSTNRGKVYFTSWSMDVKIEGKNAVRMMDMTTHNHMSVPGNTPPWLYVDGIDSPPPPAVAEKCKDDFDTIDEVCAEDEDPCAAVAYVNPDGSNKDKRSMTPQEADDMRTAAKQNDCLVASKCKLQPYKPSGCCQGQTPHHIVEKSSFTIPKGDGSKSKHTVAAATGGPNDYKPNAAPCICAEGPSQHRGSHAEMHTIQGWLNSGDTSDGSIETTTKDASNQNTMVDAPVIKYKDARDNGAAAVSAVFPESACSEDCIKAQLDAYHCDHCGIDENADLNSVMAGNTTEADADAALANIGGPPAGFSSNGM